MNEVYLTKDEMGIYWLVLEYKAVRLEQCTTYWKKITKTEALTISKSQNLEIVTIESNKYKQLTIDNL